MDDVVVGIDLGTTNSCIAVYTNNKLRILENKSGGRITPSVVYFDKKRVVIGQYAKKMAVLNPSAAVFEIKRLIGRQIDDPYVQNNLRFYPFNVDKTSEKTTLLVEDSEKKIVKKSPMEICAFILRNIKEDGETKLGHPINKAVITVPAYFNLKQREVTLNAAKEAGFTVLKLLNEPTAAALSFYLTKPFTKEEYSLVYDLGGGTFDVAILKRSSDQIEIISVDGDSHLGGQDFDNLIIDYVCKELLTHYKFVAAKDRRNMRRLQTLCEDAKKDLSVSEETSIVVEGLVSDEVIEIKFTRKQFENMTDEILKKTIRIVDGCLKSCKLSKEKIKEVILAGGSSRIPKIQQLLSEYFEGKALNYELNQDECVAEGAAIQAAMLSNNPSQKIEGIKISDVTPLSLGIKGLADIMNVVIKRNTPIPVRVSEVWSNVYDGQHTLSFQIYEGERLNALKNHFLGELNITNLTPAPPDQCKVILTMSIDNNGILSVSAQEKYKNNVKDLKVTYARGHRSDSEVKNTLKDAEEHREEDERYIRCAKQKKYLLEYCVGVIYNLENQKLVNAHKAIYDLCLKVKKEVGETQGLQKFIIENKMDILKRQCDPLVINYAFKFMPDISDLDE